MKNHDTPIDTAIHNPVMEFICKSASFYKTESLRLQAIESPLVAIWGPFSALKVGMGDSACDGNLVTNFDGQVAYRMIVVAKNEIGLGECDPTIQIYSAGWGGEGGGVFEEVILQEGPTRALCQIWLHLKATML